MKSLYLLQLIKIVALDDAYVESLVFLVFTSRLDLFFLLSIVEIVARNDRSRPYYEKLVVRMGFALVPGNNIPKPLYALRCLCV